MLVGQDNDTLTPLIYVLPSTAETPTLIPSTDLGILNEVAFGPDGTAILGGELFSGPPLAYRIPLGSTTLIPITFPGTTSATIQSLAVAPDGTAIFVGQDFITDSPVIYTLSPHSTAANTNITIPFPVGHEGAFTTIEIGPNGDAIIAGNDTTGLLPFPIVYRLPQGSTTAILISNPNAHHGNINEVTVGSDNTAVIGGEDLDTQQPLIYRLPSGATTCEFIQNPNSDLGFITAADFQDNGTVAVLVGDDNHDGTFTTPLIYLLPPHASQAQLVTNLTNHLGGFQCVSVGNNGTLIAGGHDSTTNTPLVYRRSSGSPDTILMNNPNSDQGFITCAEIDDSNGSAILAGQDITADSTPLIYRLLPTTNTCISVFLGENPDDGQINAMDIFSFEKIRSFARPSNNR